MNITDFLIENYIWILVIILITIITIIGFLADKKKNNKKKDNPPVENMNNNGGQVANNITPIQYNAQPQMMSTQMNNNANLEMNANNFNNPMIGKNEINNMQNVPSINNGNTMDNNNLTQTEPVSTTPIGVNTNMMNNPSPIESVVPNINPEPIYQPLSEQKPVIPPQPIPNINNIPNNNQRMINPIEDALNINNQNINLQMGQTTYNQPVPMTNPIPSEPIVNQNSNFTNQQNGMSGTMNNNMNMSNYYQNNTTIPEPVNVIPTPQPVNPQPITQGIYNNVPTSGANNYNQTIPQQNLNQQQSVTQQTPNQPINFVYGPQNNNQNM